MEQGLIETLNVIFKNDGFKTIFSVLFGGVVSAIVGYFVNTKIGDKKIKKDLQVKAAEEITSSITTVYESIYDIVRFTYSKIFNPTYSLNTTDTELFKRLIIKYNESVNDLTVKIDLRRLVIGELFYQRQEYITEITKSKKKFDCIDNLLTLIANLKNDETSFKNLYEEVDAWCDTLIMTCAKLKQFNYEIQDKLYGQFFSENNSLKHFQETSRSKVLFMFMKEDLINTYLKKYVIKS